MASTGERAAPDAATGAPSESGAWAGLRNPSLGTKLIVFSTLLTAVAVCLAFALLSVSMRRHTKRLLAGTLAHHQSTILHLQSENLEELLRVSSLMTDSPTLRAAIETYAAESSPRAPARADLLATIQHELDKVAAGLRRDLFVVTDRKGRVLAASGGTGPRPAIGRDLSEHALLRHALEQDGPVGPDNLAVWNFDGAYLRVGSVPIVLQGYVIGSLTLGDRIGDTFVRQLQRSFDCDFVVLAGDEVVGSTLDVALGPSDVQQLSSRSRSSASSPAVARLADDEYVTTTVALGTHGEGQSVDLYLLHSLHHALADSNRFLLGVLLSCGLSAVLLAGAAGLVDVALGAAPARELRGVHALGGGERRSRTTLRAPLCLRRGRDAEGSVRPPDATRCSSTSAGCCRLPGTTSIGSSASRSRRSSPRSDACSRARRTRSTTR